MRLCVLFILMVEYHTHMGKCTKLQCAARGLTAGVYPCASAELKHYQAPEGLDGPSESQALENSPLVHLPAFALGCLSSWNVLSHPYPFSAWRSPCLPSGFS